MKNFLLGTMQILLPLSRIFGSFVFAPVYSLGRESALCAAEETWDDRSSLFRHIFQNHVYLRV